MTLRKLQIARFAALIISLLPATGLAIGKHKPETPAEDASPSPSDSPTSTFEAAPSPTPTATPSATPSPLPSPEPIHSPKPSPSPEVPPAPATPAGDSPSPAPAARDHSLPAVLADIEQEYAKSETLSAHFSQVEKLAALDQVKQSEGVILIRRPDKIRWETQKPDPNLLVGNGRKFWFYTPPFDEGERGQVIEQDARKVRSRLAHALLSGSFSVARDMKIERVSPEHFRLIPKKGTAGTVREAELFVSAERKRIVKVILHHEGGNTSEISLSDIKLGASLPDSLFKFVTPPNTDKMQGE